MISCLGTIGTVIVILMGSNLSLNLAYATIDEIERTEEERKSGMYTERVMLCNPRAIDLQLIQILT